jgi:hypothetical protein
MVGSIALALSLAGSAVGQVYTCALETEARQALGAAVITEAVATPGREIVSIFTSDYRHAAVLDPRTKAPDLMACISLEANRTVVCTTSGDQKALVLFQEGRFSLSVQTQDPDRWVVASGTCTKPGREADV